MTKSFKLCVYVNRQKALERSTEQATPSRASQDSQPRGLTSAVSLNTLGSRGTQLKSQRNFEFVLNNARGTQTLKHENYEVAVSKPQFEFNSYSSKILASNIDKRSKKILKQGAAIQK